MVSKWLFTYGYNIIMINIGSYHQQMIQIKLSFKTCNNFSIQSMDKSKIEILQFGTFSFFFFPLIILGFDT